MARVIAGMTSSLDGFVADQDGSAGRLYPDLAALRGTPYMNAMIEETGAVLMGKRTFEMAEDPDWYVGQYEFQVPLFVLTHEPPKGHTQAGRTPDLHLRDRRCRVSGRAGNGRGREQGGDGRRWRRRRPATATRWPSRRPADPGCPAPVRLAL